jgi:hypothetical protein
MGLAQLSNRLLVPPDGLTFATGTSGELFGNAWMALPLTEAKRKSADNEVPYGDQSWTLFINSANFKGPVAFWIAPVWSRIARGNPNAVGRGLDARPAVINGGAIEINTVPLFASRDARGLRYTRIPRLQFPVDAEGHTVLMQDFRLYSTAALSQQLRSWFGGGGEASGRFDEKASHTPQCSTAAISVRQGAKNARITGIDAVVETTMLGKSSYGLKWKHAKTIGFFPEYFKQDGDKMVAIAASDVPDETRLKQQSFASARTGKAYTSPDGAGTVWAVPGPKTGPFTATLSDGTVITYAWYRFVDQPSLQAFRFSEAEKQRLQRIAELIHARWTITRDYMPPPTRGTLATFDPALIVVPPAGLERGYVPIVTRQALQ